MILPEVEIIISYILVLHTPTHCLQNIGYSFEWVRGTIHMLHDQRPEEVSSQFMYLQVLVPKNYWIFDYFLYNLDRILQ